LSCYPISCYCCDAICTDKRSEKSCTDSRDTLLNDRGNCLLNKRQYLALIKRRDFEHEQFFLFQINQHEHQTDHLRKQSGNRRTVKSDEVDKNRVEDRIQNC